ncbi:MAG: sulfotransferase domain-containing protein [Chloroflexi bacterium]|nr:sulfotransferase domain-containing protein [Chloroflexota bacterium]
MIYQIKKPIINIKISKRGTEAYIISYPKCGRTWLRLMMGKVICDHYNLSNQLMLHTYELTTKSRLLKTHFSHDYSSIRSGFPYQYLPIEKSGYAQKKVLFLIREIKDVLVSSYFQATRRTGKFNGSLSKFIRSPQFGVKKVVSFYNSWYEQQDVPQAFLLLPYEDMIKNPDRSLIQVLSFIGLQDAPDPLIKTAVQFASFDNMQKMEKIGLFHDDKLRPAQENDQESYKVRKGKIGGHKAYLSQDDIAYIDTTIVKMGCPFIEQNYQ